MGDYHKRTIQWAELCREFGDCKAELFRLLRAVNAPFGEIADGDGGESPPIDAMDPVDWAEARLADVQQRMKAFIQEQDQAIQ